MPHDRGYRWQELGARIKEARKNAGLTQRRLGELVGVNAHTVWCWEAGRMKPTHEHLVELALQCEASTSWLLGQDVIMDELLKEAEVSFRGAVEGLPAEDLESILNFIRFVRQERRGRR